MFASQSRLLHSGIFRSVCSTHHQTWTNQPPLPNIIQSLDLIPGPQQTYTTSRRFYRATVPINSYVPITYWTFMHDISCLYVGLGIVLRDGIRLDNRPMGPIFHMRIGQILGFGMHRMWLRRIRLPVQELFDLIQDISCIYVGLCIWSMDIWIICKYIQYFMSK